MNDASRITADNGPMLNAYPDSIGKTLGAAVEFLGKPELADVFTSFYILPSVFHSDLDRGFSVIDYNLNNQLAKAGDLHKLRSMGIDLKLDFILNHASVLSPQFQDLLKNGKESVYRDFFIDWNQFWAGRGEMTPEGYIQPDKKYLEPMFFRKPGLPILMVRMPDGSRVPYWNTFYQELCYPRPDVQELMEACGLQYSAAVCQAELLSQQLDAGTVPEQIDYEGFEDCRDAVIRLLESRTRYLGQMDLNIKSSLVWEFYEETVRQLADYGARIVRLDAFAYAPKEPGEKNFLNVPGTWELLEGVRKLADRYSVQLLPEIHTGYGERIHEQIAAKGYMTYDFFLPGLIIDALERGCGDALASWGQELMEKGIRVVNMLGCHDGIPLLDLKGMLPEERIQKLIDIVVERGGYVKNLHGQKNVYYQVNATYYSALGEDDRKMLLARALQLFMPGKPQIWYLDLFAGKNDYQAVEQGGTGGHKEINRTNLSWADIERQMGTEIVTRQLELLRFRKTFPAFAFDAEFAVTAEASQIKFSWRKERCIAELAADLGSYDFEITGVDAAGMESFRAGNING